MEARVPPCPRRSSTGPWLDIGPALLLAAVIFLGTAVGGWHAAGPLRPGALPLLAAAPLALAARRRWPLPTYAVALGCTMAYLLGGSPPGPILAAPFAGLLAVIATRSPRLWLAAAAAGAALLALAHGLGQGWSPGVVVFAAVWLALAGAIGTGVQARRRFAAEVRARARLAEESRQEQARRRIAEERLRIAREMHDVMGHSLAVVTLQAGVAAHLLETRPEDARQAIAAIRQVSRKALGELRYELAMLRGEGGDGPGWAPTPGLRDLGELVASVRDAGLDVRLDADLPAGVPEIVSAAAYRIVQEALTNVARHAGPRAVAAVRVAAAEEVLSVEVADDGRGMPAGTPEGTGLTGMRERVEALGGELRAGNAPQRGFSVQASLPWRRP